MTSPDSYGIDRTWIACVDRALDAASSREQK